MTILDIIKAVKIDFTQVLIITDSCSVLEFEFEIMPKEFLSYSKQDFKSRDKRGNINALTNAKRAIDCQIDKIFSSLGLDPNDFPSVIEDYTENSKNSPTKKDLPIRLRFLQAMSFAPAEIIAKTRNLRNKLEHYYKEPTENEVSEAIELAELFILATDNKLKTLWNFLITDKSKNNESKGYLWDSVYVTFNDREHYFETCGYIGKNDKKELKVNNTDLVFYYLLKIATSFDYIEDVQDAALDFIEYIGHPIPIKNVKFENE